jgi:threonine dehydratase
VLELEDIQAAARRLEGVAHRTPVVGSRTLNRLTGLDVVLKPENLQRGGAFKFRGAFNKLSSLSQAERERGVAAYSSGNHAQAVAIAASLVGTTAVILMPEDAPAAKVVATRGYGAEVVSYDRWTQDREALGAALAEDRGLTLVPPYDDPLVMAGQGTAALELVEDAGPLDALVVPVGGGGLAAGCATAAKGHRHERTRVVGVEPEAGNDTQRSLEAGERTGGDVPQTIADGLQSAIPGRLTFPVVQARVDEIVTVTDAELVEALRFAFDRLKLVLEPSGAAALAALLAGKVEAEGRVGAILSGGNVGVERFVELVTNRH